MGTCRITNVCYSISCMSCNKTFEDKQPSQGTQSPAPSQGQTAPGSQYYGETAKNMASRSAEHTQLLKARDSDSPLWKHCLEVHGGDMEAANFVMKLVSRHMDPLSRLITEGVLIKGASQGSLMNSRGEFRQSKVARVIITRTLGDPTARTQWDPQEDPAGLVNPSSSISTTRASLAELELAAGQPTSGAGQEPPTSQPNKTKPKRGRPKRDQLMPWDKNYQPVVLQQRQQQPGGTEGGGQPSSQVSSQPGVQPALQWFPPPHPGPTTSGNATTGPTARGRETAADTSQPGVQSTI
jgi:hypothetical protein